MLPRLVLAAGPPLAAALRPLLTGPDGWDVADAPTPEAAATVPAVPAPDAVLIEPVLLPTVGERLIDAFLGPRDAAGRTCVLLLGEAAEAVSEAVVLAPPFDATIAGRVRQAVDAARFRHHLARLDKLGGAPFVREMVDLFLNLTPGRVANIRAAVEAGDLDAARFACHQMKSSAGNLGALYLYDLAHAGEALAAAGRPADLAGLPPRIEAAFDRARQFLAAHVSMQGPS